MRIVTVTPKMNKLYEDGFAKGVELITNGFTIGKPYTGVVSENGRLAVVRNDNGHERVVGLDGKPTAHIKGIRNNGRSVYWPNLFEKCVGFFEVKEEQAK